MSMFEKVGTCSSCGEEICCENGFLNGVVTGEGKLLCFKCTEKDETSCSEA